jgi:phosphatidylinositol alpha-1,6-mannosyltransferase
LQIRKGHDMLIQALPSIRASMPDVLYAIVGEGVERQRLEALVTSLQLQDCVKFHGEISDAEMLQAYQQCDLFVLPNREVDGDFEGFGMVLIEAQACGKVVIAGASGGTSETLNAGQTGFVIPCETPEPLANKIMELLGDTPRLHAMGKAAREWVLERFDWTSLVQQAKQIFGETKA